MFKRVCLSNDYFSKQTILFKIPCVCNDPFLETEAETISGGNVRSENATINVLSQKDLNLFVSVEAEEEAPLKSFLCRWTLRLIVALDHNGGFFRNWSHVRRRGKTRRGNSFDEAKSQESFVLIEKASWPQTIS